MRVAIDTTALDLNKAGVHVYLRELLAALRNREDVEVLPVQYAHQTRHAQRWRRKLDTLYRDVFWRNLVLPRHIRHGGADVLHAPQPRSPFAVSVPTVMTVYDCYVYHNPRGYTRWSAFLYHVVPTLLRRAAVIVAISEFTRRELLRFVPGLDAEKIVVTPLGVSSRFRPASDTARQAVRLKYNLPERFLLAVNTLEPRKNLLRFLEVYAGVQERVEEDLVLVGSPGWVPEHAASVVETMQQNERIHYLGYVPDEDLVTLYSMASAYVFPSSYEGFGLPAVEAMACGCPVLTSRGSSLDEVVGEAALQFDPYDAEEMGAAILRMTASAALREDFRERGFANAKRFTWKQTAAETVAAYAKALT